MGDDDFKAGVFQGETRTKLTAHDKRITRLEVAMIALVVYLASRTAEKLMGLL